MRLMKRNLREIAYCNYLGRTDILDTDGYETGETKRSYSDVTTLQCSVSPAKGLAQTEMFGNLESYDKVIVTDNMDCPIDEHSVLFVDKSPEFVDGEPIGDYTVKRVAKSLNYISYAVSKVTVS